MKWRECVGGCENLQGELRGGWGGGVTPAVNGGAGEKTRRRCSGDMEGRLYYIIILFYFVIVLLTH